MALNPLLATTTRPFIQMKNDRLGLVMIVATLIVIGLIGGLLYQYQLKLHLEKIRASGVTLSRALSSTEYSQLVSESGQNSLMSRLISVQANKEFAYGVVVDRNGKPLGEALSSGAAVPNATMPSEPYAWYGEHSLVAPGDGRKIKEFFAPVLDDGALAGFVRVGYYETPSGFLGNDISSLALMALPVFLLTTLSFLLIRRELKPLGQLGKRIEEASQSYGPRPQAFNDRGELGDFVQRLDRFLQLVQSRVQEMDATTVSARTATHLLSYKQEKAESALNAIPEGVLVIDDECVVTFSNIKAESVLGISRTEIVGRSPQEWCDNPTVLAFLMRFKNAPPAMRQTSIEYVPDGHPDRRIVAAAFPLFSPRDQHTLFGRLIVFRDVSKEFQIRQAGAEFVAHVSHELKTPLNTLTAYSELLLDHDTLEEGDRVQAVNVIHGEVERMTGLINNLLNVAKLETGTLQLARKRVKVRDLLQDCFDNAVNNARGKNIEIQLGVSPELGSARLDKALFRIAIDNLLSNAIKYSNPGGHVVLGAELLDDDQMQITVSDQGIGISAEDCAKVFDKYYRAGTSETMARSGHGLGLYLAKTIVELHHGTIAVDSAPGKGSTFIITLKAQAVQLEEMQVS